MRWRIAILTSAAVSHPDHQRVVVRAVIPDDIQGYAELKPCGRVPLAGGEPEFTLCAFRELLASHAFNYIQFDTNPGGGLTQARKIAALGEALSVAVVPRAGQMHKLCDGRVFSNGRRRSRQRIVVVHLGRGTQATKGSIDLDNNMPGLGLTVNENRLKEFELIESNTPRN